MIAWLLCENTGTDYIAIGIGATEQEVKEMAIDGHYLLVPITVGNLYPNIVSDQITGAIQFTKEGVNTKLDDLSQRIDNLKNAATTKLNQLQNSIDTIDTRLDGIDASLASLDARVTALENP